MAHYDEVVAFAELGDALDYPMRTYSSGMFARLGFAVASHLDPEIMLIDEALSAGDARFKKRCMDKLVELCGRDCTVMIISHGLGLIKYLAERCVWLDPGEVRLEGPGDEVVDAYLTSDDIARRRRRRPWTTSEPGPTLGARGRRPLLGRGRGGAARAPVGQRDQR